MTQRIPKIIHYCWFGGQPIPKETQEHIKTWGVNNPDYEIREWNETNFNFNKYRYAQEAYSKKKWAFVSDVCRLEKVYKFGGIYIDVNTDVIKSFDDFLDEDLFIGFEQDNKIAAGVFGAKKNHPIIKNLLKRYKKEKLIDKNGKISFKTINDRVEPELIKLGLVKNNSLQKKQNFTVYPKEYFQPRYWNSPKQDKLTNKTHTIHYFGASWHDSDKRDFLNKLTSADQPLVSVIIPIYNVEKYINECVDSVINQTYQNIEIILVDDKTQDNSGKIADKYAEQDVRIKVIHKLKNEGLNMARATGFEASVGEFVMFVDSDDLITRDCLEFAISEIYKNKTDFVKFNYAKFKDNRTLLKLKKDTTHQQDIVSVVIEGKKELYKTRFKNNAVGISAVCVWGGLYSAATVRKMDWKESNYRINEDNFWTMQLFEHVNSGTYTSRIGYLYRSDDSYQGVLSKALTGNSFNGKPVGYLEFIKEYFEKFRYYNKKYKLELDQDIDLLEAWNWVDRLMNLSRNNMLNVENNSDFLPLALSHLVKQYQDKKELNDKRKIELKKLQEEKAKLLTEIKSFHSLKRSVRLLLGNAKRKIKSLTTNRL